MLAQREVVALVHDAVNLEGIAFTFPEIQTLLDGVTVGGHKLSDQQIAINQAKAWKQLFSDLKQNNFVLTAEYACKLHSIAAKEDALEWGKFRTSGVTIAGTEYLPPAADRLAQLFAEMVDRVTMQNDIYDQAISLFLQMARTQFFYDVNKRMGRFMMNGHLLNQGYPVINLPAARQLEFNQLMLDFYQTGEEEQMKQFMKSCLDQKVVDIMSSARVAPSGG